MKGRGNTWVLGYKKGNKFFAAKQRAEMGGRYNVLKPQ